MVYLSYNKYNVPLGAYLCAIEKDPNKTTLIDVFSIGDHCYTNHVHVKSIIPGNPWQIRRIGNIMIAF